MRRRLEELGRLSGALLDARAASGRERRVAALRASAAARRGAPLSQEHRDKIAAGARRARRYGLPPRER